MDIVLLINSKTLESEITGELIWTIGDHDIDDVTMIAPIFDLHEFDHSKSNFLKPNSEFTFLRKRNYIFLCSIILHTLAFYLISMRVQIPNFKEDTVEPIIVQATLYKPPSPRVTHEPERNEIIEVKQKVVPEIEELVVPDNKKDVIEIDETKKVLPEIIKAPFDIIEESVKELNISMSEIPQETLHEAPSTPTESIVDSTISKYIRRLDQAKLNNLAKQVSKDYQYNKSHPEIIAATKKILSHDEQLQKSIEREVDCKTMTGKILNIFSGLGHGTGIGNGPVKSGKYSGLKSFIKKR
jgi:hypothetical protein